MMRIAMAAAMVVSLGSAAVAPAQQVPVADPAKSKMICKRSTDTGSMIAKRRECRTKRDWDRISEAARMGGQDLVDRNMGRPPGQ